MKEVIAKMDSEFKSINSRIDGMNSLFNDRFKTAYWVIAIAGATITVLLAIIALKK